MQRASYKLVVLALLVLFSGCRSGDDAETRTWLAKVSKLHHKADDALDKGDLNTARRVLEKLVSGKIPDSLAQDILRPVMQDAYFRLARVEIRDGKFTKAIMTANRGLELGCKQDLFCANLYIAKAEAMEKTGKDMAAIEAYNKALSINEKLLEEWLVKKKEMR